MVLLNYSLSLSVAIFGNNKIVCAAEHAHTNACDAAVQHYHSNDKQCYEVCGEYQFDKEHYYQDDDCDAYYYAYKCSVCRKSVDVEYAETGTYNGNGGGTFLLTGNVKVRYTYVLPVNYNSRINGTYDFNRDGVITYSDCIALASAVINNTNGIRATQQEANPGTHFSNNLVCSKTSGKYYDAYGDKLNGPTYYCNRVVTSIQPRK